MFPEIRNYRPVLVLSSFLKIMKIFFKGLILLLYISLSPNLIRRIEKRIAQFTIHVLLRLIEQWKSALDNKNYVGAVLMDLSKAFDCIPHDLLIGKLHVYGFSENSLTFFYFYLK